MVFKIGFVKRIIFFLIFHFAFSITFCLQSYSVEEVIKVLKAIEKVEKGTVRRTKRSLEQISITESELNSYIAYRIEEENERYLKELRIKLFKKNKIEGRILVDLQGEDVPKFLKPQMTLFFGGELEAKDGKVRLILKDLFLEEQRIDPNVLDFLIAFVAKIGNYEVWSLKDWWELPHGIKDVKTQRGKATFYY